MLVSWCLFFLSRDAVLIRERGREGKREIVLVRMSQKVTQYYSVSSFL